MKVTPLQHEVVQQILAGYDTPEKLVELRGRRVSVSLILNGLSAKGVINYDIPIQVIKTDYEVGKQSYNGKTNRKPTPIQEHVAAVRKCLSCGSGFNSEWKGHRVCNGCKETDTWRGSLPGYDMPQRRAS